MAKGATIALRKRKSLKGGKITTTVCLQNYVPVIFLKKVQVPVFGFLLNQVIGKTSHEQKGYTEGLEEEASATNVD